MSMLRSETVAELEGLAARLEADLSRAQTRDQHVTLSQRVTEVRDLVARLREPAV